MFVILILPFFSVIAAFINKLFFVFVIPILPSVAKISPLISAPSLPVLIILIEPFSVFEIDASEVVVNLPYSFSISILPILADNVPEMFTPSEDDAELITLIAFVPDWLVCPSPQFIILPVISSFLPDDKLPIEINPSSVLFKRFKSMSPDTVISPPIFLIIT